MQKAGHLGPGSAPRLLLKGQFFLAIVTKYLLMGECLAVDCKLMIKSEVYNSEVL